jgi:GBP family porin
MKLPSAAAGTALLCLTPLCATAQYAPTADPSLQIYGRLDASVNVQKYSGESGSRKAVSSDTSLIGFRATEQLGNGRAAYFKMESGLSVDKGTQASPAAFWNREVFVGLSDASLGAVELGTHWTPAIWLAGKVDPFVRSQLGAQFTLLQGTGVRGYAVQFANSVAYVSPNLAGLQGRVMLQAPEGALGKNRALGLDYARDRLFVGLSYDDTEATGASVGQPLVGATRSKTLGVGATYRFDAAKLFGYVQQNRVANLSNVNGYLVGVAVPVGPGEFRASYAHTNRSNAQASLAAVGYNYFLSKRSLVYATVAQLDNSGTAAFGMWPSSQDFAAPRGGQDIKGIQFGVRHTF